MLVRFDFRNGAVDRPFWGYAGFGRLEIADVSPEMITSLRTLYGYLRTQEPQELQVHLDEQGEREEVEMNSFQLLVYNRDVDWKKQRLCLKYNSQWHTFPPESANGVRGQDRYDDARPITDYLDAEAYQPFLGEYQAVATDLRDADRFDGLKVAIPDDVAWGRVFVDSVAVPLVTKAADIQLVIFPDDYIRPIRYFNRCPSVRFYTVTEDGIFEHMWDANRLLATTKWTLEYAKQGGLDGQLKAEQRLGILEAYEGGCEP